MKFSVYQVSDKGGREKNEDRMGYCYTRDAALFALADGMGGHPQGEVASQLALQTLATRFLEEAQSPAMEAVRFLESAFIAAHRLLLRHATQCALLDTPRTTAVACVIQGGVAYWAHCGDSRLYLVRNGQMLFRTRDHSYAELQRVQPEAARARHANRHVLFTCLGSPSRPVVDCAGPIVLQKGDRLLLCSDGLWGSVPDALITRQLAARPVSEAVPELVKLALSRGGPKGDNVTVLALEWIGAEDAEADDSISTEMLGEKDFSSVLQPSALGAPGSGGQADLLDDAEIERSIREINEAIRRSELQRRR